MTIDLTTHYGGLELVSPIVVGACPLTANEQTRSVIESSGAGAIVLPSLFEEQVIRWCKRTGRTLSQRDRDLLKSAKRMGADTANSNAEAYLSAVNRASTQLSIPVIASLNGYAGSGWIDFAAELQEAGARGIELNIHHPPPSEYDGPREVEDALVDTVRGVDAEITIPLFVKLGHDYTSMPHLARRLMSGVQGLVLHGRSPDVDICLDTLKLNRSWGLTQPGSIAQSLAAIMRVHTYCPAIAIAATGGIATADDVFRVLLAGADVAMVTSALYREGPSAVRGLTDALLEFMERHEMRSVQDLHHQRPIEFAKHEERVAYMAALSSARRRLSP